MGAAATFNSKPLARVVSDTYHCDSGDGASPNAPASLAMTVSGGDDDLRGRTFDATCNSELDGELSSQLEFPARIRIARCRKALRSYGAGTSVYRPGAIWLLSLGRRVAPSAR
jgi:hypothetical protein